MTGSSSGSGVNDLYNTYILLTMHYCSIEHMDKELDVRFVSDERGTRKAICLTRNVLKHDLGGFRQVKARSTALINDFNNRYFLII